MAKLTRDQLLKRPFADRQHYPYGFSRSGDFSIAESQALSQYGSLIQALCSGELLPSTPEEHDLLAMSRGEKPAQTLMERAWDKYQRQIHRVRRGNIYGGKPATVEAANDEDDLDNDDLLMDEA